MSYPPGISSSLPRKLSHLRTPLTNTLLLGASAQQLIFSAQRDTVCALDHGKLSHLAPVHPNLSCSSDPTANRQSLSLFSRQAPTVSGAEAPPTPVSPPPCTMSPQSWERRGPSALLPGLLLSLPPSTRAGSWLVQAGEWQGGDERSVPRLLRAAPLREEALGVEGRRGLACSAVRTQGEFRGG